MIRWLGFILLLSLIYIFPKYVYSFVHFKNNTSQDNFEIKLSKQTEKIMHRGVMYYYDLGFFYVKGEKKNYYFVSPPIGIIVKDIPPSAKEVIKQDTTYYCLSGICYQEQHNGFKVDFDFDVSQLGEQVMSEDQFRRNYQQIVVINLGNINGDFKTVTLNRMDGGFLGPDGEYYQEFPNVDELKKKYTQ